MSFRKTYAGAEPVRVNKWLAQEGVCSRREADALIADGLVSIDGARVDDAGRRIEPGQTLTLAEKAQKQLQSVMSFVLNKPVGFVSAQPEPGQTPAARLLTKQNLWTGPPPSSRQTPQPAGKMPAVHDSFAPLGRLDQDSHGLLLLSDDGVLAKAVIGPKSKLDKEYIVRVAGAVTERKIALLRHGLELDNRQLKPAQVKLIAAQTLRFVLLEGRNRQIRRMCELVDLDVRDLQRIRIGPLELSDLPEGRWRPLTQDERASLIAASR